MTSSASCPQLSDLPNRYLHYAINGVTLDGKKTYCYQSLKMHMFICTIAKKKCRSAIKRGLVQMKANVYLNAVFL